MDVVIEIPGRWSVLPELPDDVAVEERAADPSLRSKYEDLSRGGLSDADLTVIAGSLRIVRLTAQSCSVGGARALLAAAAEVLNAGGTAVQVVNVGLVHTAREWHLLAERSSNDALVQAFVSIEEDGLEAWTEGMYAFGLKDAILVGGQQWRPGFVLRMFLHTYLGADGAVHQGQAFAPFRAYRGQPYDIETLPPDHASTLYGNPNRQLRLTLQTLAAPFSGLNAGSVDHEGPSLALLEPPPLSSLTLERLKALAAPSVRLRGASGRKVPVGGSKLGGRPDLPPEMPWPVVSGVAQAFICQVNLADVAEAFPAARATAENIGHLLFFFDPAFRCLDDEMMEFLCHVVSLRRGAALGRCDFPDELDDYWRFSELAVDFATELMDIPVQTHEVRDLGLSTEEQLAWGAHVESEGSPRHRMFGYPEPIQYDDPRVWEDQTLLLQVDADDDAGADWGDVGRLFFLIDRDDLAEHRFDDVRLGYQSH